ncbi:MAG: hypothetical protein ABIB71_07860, partial [Candidatus Woesearchaeota archaeon]
YKSAKRMKELGKEQVTYCKNLLPKAKINWIKDDDLESAYNASSSEKPPKLNAYKNDIIKAAVHEVVREDKPLGPFRDVYKQQLAENKIIDDPSTVRINGKDD